MFQFSRFRVKNSIKILHYGYYGQKKSEILRYQSIFTRIKKIFTSGYNIRNETLELLKLSKFTEEEFSKSFQSLRTKDYNEGQIHLKDGLKQLSSSVKPDKPLNEEKIELMCKAILGSGAVHSDSKHQMLSYNEFRSSVTTLAEKLDPRIYQLGFSFLLVGTSVGIIIPCMPLLVSKLEISPAAFGIVISAFGLSRLLGNVPSGFLVEKYGRKSVLMGGLVLCGVANFAISFILYPGLGTPWLIFCRFVGGLGVAAFISGGQMIISDISTNLNRTRTIAPVMAAFSAGTALGPALGGVLVDLVGLTNTYAIVGGCFGLIAIKVHFMMTETMKQKKKIVNIKTPPLIITEGISPISPVTPPLPSLTKEIRSSFTVASNSWKTLMKRSEIRNMITLNTLFWFSLAGAQFTLLPLHLVNDQFNFTPSEIGSCFAYSSIISLLCSQPIAYISDKFGKQKVMIFGTTLVSFSVFAIPFTSSLYELLAVLTPFSMGLTCMSAATPALITDLTSSDERAQALSLLRTSSDMGFLFGATFSGLLASHISTTAAFLTDGGTVVAAVLLYLMRSRAIQHENDKK
jgi:MFS family permease